MRDDGWHFNRNGQTTGPVPGEVLRQMIMAGHVGQADLIWREGWPAWQPAASVPELAQSFPAAVAHPTAAGHSGPPIHYAYQAEYRGKSYQGFAIAGFVLSLTFPILGLIFSWVALNGMKAQNNDEGRGLAVAGMVISCIFVGLGCLWFIAFFTCLAAGAGASAI